MGAARLTSRARPYPVKAGFGGETPPRRSTCEGRKTHERMIKMEKVKVRVEYKAGESRYSNKAVDWMLAVVPIYEDGVHVDDVELYAEAENPTWDEDGGYYEDERATFEELKAEIFDQAEEKGIDLSQYELIYE
jgi:hypothetical protein